MSPTLPPSAAQDDLLHEALTVYECLFYAAMLRLPRTMSHADKLHRIDVIITALGLKQCRDTIVGGCGSCGWVDRRAGRRAGGLAGGGWDSVAARVGWRSGWH